MVKPTAREGFLTTAREMNGPTNGSQNRKAEIMDMQIGLGTTLPLYRLIEFVLPDR